MTLKEIGNYEGNNWILFREIFRYPFGSQLFLRNVIGNILLFLPYGFFVSYYFEVKKKRIIFFLSCFLSLSIEFIQLQIGRVFDVDDILLNVIGSMLGYLIYSFCYHVGGSNGDRSIQSNNKKRN